MLTYSKWIFWSPTARAVQFPPPAEEQGDAKVLDFVDQWYPDRGGLCHPQHRADELLRRVREEGRSKAIQWKGDAVAPGDRRSSVYISYIVNYKNPFVYSERIFVAHDSNCPSDPNFSKCSGLEQLHSCNFSPCIVQDISWHVPGCADTPPQSPLHT